MQCKQALITYKLCCVMLSLYGEKDHCHCLCRRHVFSCTRDPHMIQISLLDDRRIQSSLHSQVLRVKLIVANVDWLMNSVCCYNSDSVLYYNMSM